MSPSIQFGLLNSRGAGWIATKGRLARYQMTVFSNPNSKLSFACHPSSRSNLEASIA